ncbi:MAG: hypothetical protein MI807_05245 [Verrucomicrobiales bacterium]|nr:hypothetical protein [Verrucomicrobiales bacterium]
MTAKNCRNWIILIFVGTLVIGFFFLRVPEGAPSQSLPSKENREYSNGKLTTEDEQIVEANVAVETEKNPPFVATRMQRPPDPEVLNAIEYPKFSKVGSGTRGAIRDDEGNVILRATSESPAVAITISPNDELIWVSGGDRKSYIINSKGDEIANLPIVPPGANMLGFGSWIWIDNHRLLGDSGVKKFDSNGKLITCCGGDNVSESRFYVYNLNTSKLEEMQLPENLRGKVISIQRVLDTGEILMGHEGDEFAWYEVGRNEGVEQ